MGVERDPGDGTRSVPQADLVDRRRSPRLELLGRLHGHVVSLNLDVIVRDVSLGGLAIETEFSFPVGALHEFRLTLTDGSSSELAARVVYSKPAPQRAGYFVTGFQFLDDGSTAGFAVSELIGRITAIR
jgi:hypothetical protein